jgi:amino acid permease
MSLTAESSLQAGCVSVGHVTENIFRAIPIVTYAFTCHYNFLDIVADYRGRHVRGVRG